MNVLANLFGRLRARASSFADQCRGSVLVETSLLIPVFLVLVMGGIEMSRYILLDHKIARVSFNAADLTARSEEPTVADVAQVFEAVEYIAEPFALGSDGTVIISSLSRAVGSEDILVNWQETGGGTGSAVSQIGSAGEVANLPSGFALREGQAVIVGETFYDYEPFFFSGFIEPRTVYHASFYRPREVVLSLDEGGSGSGDDDDSGSDDDDHSDHDDDDHHSDHDDDDHHSDHDDDDHHSDHDDDDHHSDHDDDDDHGDHDDDDHHSDHDDDDH